MQKTTKYDVYIRGARMRYMVPNALHQHKLLNKLYTDAFEGDKIGRILKALQNKVKLSSTGIDKYLQRKPNFPGQYIVSFPFLNLIKEISHRLWARGFRKALEMNVLFMKIFDRRVKLSLGRRVNNLYGINGDCLEVLRHVKKIDPSKQCVVEQCILPLRLQIDLYKQIPGFTLDQKFDIDYIAYREEEEWKIADKIIAPSNFVRDGLIKLGVPQEKVHLVPYCTDNKKFKGKARTQAHETLRVLFVGNITYRKGVHLIAEILKVLPMKYECKLAGVIVDDMQNIFHDLNASFLGSLATDKIVELYDWADVFLFPTYIEGSANVVYEALATGLPTITTYNCGSVITNGSDGLIVDNVTDINKYVSFLCMLHKNNDIYSEISKNALNTASSNDFYAFSKRLTEVLTT